MPSGRLALFPGTFDPFTYGHLDIVERATQLFDAVEVTVAVNVGKEPLLTLEERCDLIRETTSHLPTVVVASFEGLLVEYANRRGAVALVRGLRQMTDFDYEFRMAFANRRLYPELETIFLMTAEQHALINASIVREIHRWSGDISSFVPDAVQKVLESKRKRLGDKG